MIIYTSPEEKRPTSKALGVFIGLSVFALPMSVSFLNRVYGQSNGVPVTAPVTSPVTPTATPTSTPIPVTPPVITVTPSPTQTPTDTPKPTRTPTPTPRTKPNNAPVISARFLPVGKVGRRYVATISAIDSDDTVNLTITGLPKGLTASRCTSWSGFGRLHVATCTITGTPQSKGITTITATAKDAFGHVVTKQLPLVINK